MNQVKLRYWMEQQVNINVYRVYVERPSELTDANLTEILLCGAANKSSVGIIEKTGTTITNQVLDFNRKHLNISFRVDGKRTYGLKIDFSMCEIDPDKCTMDSVDKHWVLRLPFYYPGNEKRCDRLYLSKDIESSEIEFFTRKRDAASNAMHCHKCNNELVRNASIRNAKKCPSSAFSYMMEHWYCLQQQGAERLQRLVPNGIFPLSTSQVLVDQDCFILMRKHVVDTAVIVAKIHYFQPKLHPKPKHCAKHCAHHSGHHHHHECDAPTKGIFCSKCKSFLGTVEIRPHLNGEGYKYIDTAALKLYKYNLREFSQKYTVDSLVGHRIATSYSSSNTRNFRVLRFIKKGVDADFSCIVDDTMFLNIAVFDVDVRCADERTTTLNQAIKILYKLYENKCVNKSNQNACGERETIYVNDDSFATLVSRLDYVNAKLPKSLSSMRFKEQMNVSVLYW